MIDVPVNGTYRMKYLRQKHAISTRIEFMIKKNAIRETNNIISNKIIVVFKKINRIAYKNANVRGGGIGQQHEQDVQ